ncbi:MAG: flagellar basal-body MS-ring/collar protein FliF [Spirochaetales bacterium]|nr:flagellar basal-body MS-ring/collar protein FliF [Spirochaetales bacterium]MDY5914947.1 flagellar basal-body MS-ring/collar protein FliF [Treponema sp.]
MNEWLKKVLTSIKDLWSKWKPIQKVILIGIIIVVIIAIVLTARISAKPTQYRILNTPITDTVRLNEILDRISEENISADSDDRGYIYVSDEVTARKLRTILSTEGLLPSNIDPFAGIFDRDIFTTDEDVKVKKLQAMQKQLTQHLETIPDIRVADVNIVSPEDKLFKEDQNPVTASVILKVTNNSDLYTNKKRIKGIQDLILSAVEGLKAENLIIADEDGNQINDFEGMAESDRIDNVKKQQKLIRQLEVEIRAKILKALQKTFTEDRCRDMVVAVEMDMSQRQSQSTEYKPIVIKEDNPDTPYDDSELRDTLPLSTQTVTKEWQGTGYNPEGPAGVEGQTPPVYSDMSNVIGKSTETGTTINHVQNRTDTTEISSPKPNKISVSVNLDGKWKKVKDNEGNLIIEDGSIKREYTPVSPEDMAEAEKSIKAAMGYDRSRGDQVAVTNIAYDRDDEFLQEDNAYFAALQRKRTILMILIAIAVVLVSFILFRIISRELERRRREREARLLAEQQAARERALWDAKEDSMEVTMSVEETRRMELQENAIAMAKEHPEDVAMLIRTWLMEE